MKSKSMRKVEPIHKVTKMKTPTLDQRIEKYENTPAQIKKEKRLLNLLV
jgi:hypothetical protein